MTNSLTGDIVRPQLSPKVRLRFDRRTGGYLLLYPETGLELNRTATEIARLCTGEWTVGEIAQYLAQIHREISLVEITRDVRGFLKTLAGRGLVQGFR
ncbi:MAG TPA: pyrroloquinoline quinone biosynthesis peptide chaperone PqqD [Nitrospiraceae bacterium]|nr:pyrroloquinoline quinone biosynthesis peptide chaperone PqqD [Nitrospiraceae bacterium]